LNFALLMPAAGSGSRLGSESPKALVPLAGKPLFVHALMPFVAHPDCLEIVIAVPADFQARFVEACLNEFRDPRIRVITGGATRQASVHLALTALNSAPDAVLIHDAARPFVSGIIIQRVLDGLKSGAVAALPGLKVADTLKLATGSPPRVQSTVPRDTLYAAQTPQAILRIVAQDAFARAESAQFQATDDVALIEHFELGDVILCEGDPRNFKVTTQADLARARDYVSHSN
jgi:2-C-methyl-D-erythritol 4-phosphate cytidylyltransferase